MSSYLDTERLAKLVRYQRGNRSLREIARIINVSASTISRAENEQTPDMDTFLALCDWLEVPPFELIKNTENTPQPTKVQSLCLEVRNDPRLSPEIATVLVALIKAAYSL